MKEFKKLALAAAVAALPMSGFAMEAMEDSALADVTGQDGIRITLGTDIAADIIIHDTDGFTNYATAGAIVLNGFSQSLNNGNIVIDVDAGTGANGAVLNVGVTLPNTMTLNLGTVQVADSNGLGNGVANAVNVMTLGTLSLGSTTLNIQLGNEIQGSMIAMNTTITGGINLANFSILDAGGAINGGGIRMANLQLLDNGGTNLTVDQDIDVDANGLVITVNQLGDATNGANLLITDLSLGDASAAVLGDIEVVGLDLTGTIRISGK